ncbi:MAG TPA: type II toxin-antitoxin system RelE/ParE family toxin [Dehalococcoidia bacterium]
MARIVWSPEASKRLIEIDAYLLLTVPERAEEIVDRLVAAVDRLAQFPAMGRAVAGPRDRDTRELIVDSFHIVYSVEGDDVEISTILHGAMDVTARLRELFGE